MTNAPVSVVFFDIGGVLLTNGWGHTSRQAAAKQFGFDYETMDDRHSAAFDIYEAGLMTLDEYLDTVLFYQPQPFSKEAFKAFMFSESKLLSPLLEWAINWRSRKPHLKVFSLNNEPLDLHRYRIESYGLKRLFDGFVCSCDVGFRKPDPHIYRVATAIVATAPQQCVYIDDREILVQAGAKAGLQARVHKTVEETTAFLETL